MEPDNPIARTVYMLVAALAGAITALSLLNWREMTGAQIWLTLFVGTSFAMFVIPWATVDILKIHEDSLRTACALTYLGGTCANAILPRVVRKISRWLKLDEEPTP